MPHREETVIEEQASLKKVKKFLRLAGIVLLVIGIGIWILKGGVQNLLTQIVDSRNQQNRTQEGMENGLRIPEPQSYDVPRVSLQKEITVAPYGIGVLFTTNCTKEVEIKELGLMPPGKTVVIRHVTHMKPEDNRCSIVDWQKHGLYWYGPEGMGSTAQFRRQYKNDAPLPIETAPPQAVVFLMVEVETGKEIASGYAKFQGDEFRLKNTSSEPARLYSGIFNYPQILKQGYERDIGYDGSTLQYAMRVEG